MPDLILMVTGECFFIHELKSIGDKIEKDGQLTYCPPHHHKSPISMYNINPNQRYIVYAQRAIIYFILALILNSLAIYPFLLGACIGWAFCNTVLSIITLIQD
jgi:hypothetical protein